MGKHSLKRINKGKNWCEKSDKIDNPLQDKQEKIEKANNVRNEKETSLKILQTLKIINKYCKQLYTSKIENLDQVDKFLEKQLKTDTRNRKCKLFYNY